MLSRGNTAGAAPSALTVSNVLFPRMTWAVMKSVNPLTHRAPKMRELFIAIEIPPGQWDSRSSEPRCLFSENVHCAPTSLGGPNDYIRQPAHAFVSYTILSLSSGAHQHAHEAECQRHPKQNPKRKPHSRTDCVRVEKLAAPVAAESPLATQHEYERQHNPANHLRCDRVILRPGDLVLCACLAASWTFDGHQWRLVRCRVTSATGPAADDVRISL